MSCLSIANISRGFGTSDSLHPGMVFLANLGVNLHVCLCGDHQVASAQMLDFLDIS
ncbi:hypothetical protein TRIP_B50410 [uncultured Desulfatiglans sp.]|nr:hypothetical protein TRIP_B50410 [uncultured Desulfatiglans sp.]